MSFIQCTDFFFILKLPVIEVLNQKNKTWIIIGEDTHYRQVKFYSETQILFLLGLIELNCGDAPKYQIFPFSNEFVKSCLITIIWFTTVMGGW